MRKLIFGTLWFFPIYFIGCFISGMFVGALEGVFESDQLASDGKIAGIFFFLCIPITSVLAIKEILPGTKSKQNEQSKLNSQ